MKVYCHKKIEIEGTHGIAVTYCMRLINHEGKCSPEKDNEHGSDNKQVSA